MDQRELLRLAREAMRKRQQKTQRRPAAPPPEKKKRDFMPDVTRAREHLSAIDARLRHVDALEDAEESVQEALGEVHRQESVRAAEARLTELQRHIDEDHIPDRDPVDPLAKDPRKAARRRRMREAYRMSILFGKPRWQDD